MNSSASSGEKSSTRITSVVRSLSEKSERHGANWTRRSSRTSSTRGPFEKKRNQSPHWKRNESPCVPRRLPNSVPASLRNKWNELKGDMRTFCSMLAHRCLYLASAHAKTGLVNLQMAGLENVSTSRHHFICARV